MAAILFYPKKERNGKYSIICRVSNGSALVSRSIGFTIDKINHWDKKKQIAKGCEESTDINAKISKWVNTFEKYTGAVKRGEIGFDFDEVLELLGKPQGGFKLDQTAPKLLEYFDQFCNLQSAMNKEGTSKQYNTLNEHLKEYQAYAKKKFVLKDINKDFYQSFGSWLIAQGNINNTVNKKITRLITFMNWAFEKQLIETQFYKIRFQFKGNDSDAHPPLLPAEIEKLGTVETDTDLQRIILDAFLFACYTGLRISDVYQLQGRHIQTEETPEITFRFIDFTQEKTSNSNTVPLSFAAERILEKYSKAGNIFNLPQEQYVNRYIKAAAKAAELHRQIEFVHNIGAKTVREFKRLCDVVSFHCGRSSYITNLLAAGVNPIFVQENAGHSDIKTTMSYSTQDRVNRMIETLKHQK